MSLLPRSIGLLVILLFGVPLYGQLAFDGSRNQNVSHGTFYPVYDGTSNTYLANTFTADAWIKIDPATSLGYVISTGYGGAHALLFGVQGDGTHYALTGNVNSLQPDGSTILISYGSDAIMRPNFWYLVSVELQNNVITTYIDGVPQSQTSFSGQRVAAAAATDPFGGEFFVGGSDHLNFTGRIGQVRIFEGNAIYSGQPFIPSISFRDEELISGTNTSVRSNLLVDYLKCGSAITDESEGYRGNRHPGSLHSAIFGLVGFRFNALPLPQCVSDPTYPTRVASVQGPPPDPPATPPSGAVVFDSFSRTDSTLLGLPTLGQTEVGQRNWSSSVPFGVQADHAVLLLPYFYASAFIDANSDGKVTVDRVGNAETGLRFRSVDDNSGWAAFTLNGVLYVDQLVNGGIPAARWSQNIGAGWSQLSVECHGTQIHAKAGTADIAIVSTTFMNASKAGLYAFAPGAIYKYDNFTFFGTLATTAASVSLAGRVLRANGQPIPNASVSVTDPALSRSVRVTSNAFGYYSIDRLVAGKTYVVTADARRFKFSTPSRMVTLYDAMAGLDFIASP